MKKIISILMILGTFGLGIAQSSYYNEYRTSINDINWDNVVSDLFLTRQQKNKLYSLNNRYSTYDEWNRVYGRNPDQWRTDRYTAIERILGKDKYKKFKNKYYKGQNPVAVYNRNKNNHKQYNKKGNKNLIGIKKVTVHRK